MLSGPLSSLLAFSPHSYFTTDSSFPQYEKPYPIHRTEGMSDFIVPKTPYSLRFVTKALQLPSLLWGKGVPEYSCPAGLVVLNQTCTCIS